MLLARGPGIKRMEVQQVLILEEQQRQLQSIKKVSNGSGDNKEKFVQGELRAEPVCYKCNKQGHFKRDCPELNGDRKNITQRNGQG